MQPDIIGLSETRIKDEPLINIDLPGYRFVHVDSLSNAGEVAALVSNNLKYVNININFLNPKLYGLSSLRENKIILLALFIVTHPRN